MACSFPSRSSDTNVRDSSRKCCSKSSPTSQRKWRGRCPSGSRRPHAYDFRNVRRTSHSSDESPNISRFCGWCSWGADFGYQCFACHIRYDFQHAKAFFRAGHSVTRRKALHPNRLSGCARHGFWRFLSTERHSVGLADAGTRGTGSRCAAVGKLVFTVERTLKQRSGRYA